ncbi:MAG TPA: hypothetical protein VFH11_03520 [Gemmatimonadota bacterium]|nr:hypothetical protein [Gemmatimonadota bacterium]
MGNSGLAVLILAAIGAVVFSVPSCAEADSGDSRPTLVERPDPQPTATIPNGGPLPTVTIASARAELDGDEGLEAVEFLVDVELGTDGKPLWEDGHRWVVLVRDGAGEDRLVDEFVPQGRLTGWVVEPEQGNPFVVVLRESGTAGIEMRTFRHAGQRGYVAAGGFDGSGRLVARLAEGEIAPPE